MTSAHTAEPATGAKGTGNAADADRGFVAALVPGVVKANDGRVVWDSDAFGTIAATAR